MYTSVCVFVCTLLDSRPRVGAIKSLSVCLSLSVHQFGIFLRNGLIVFPDFWRDGG